MATDPSFTKRNVIKDPSMMKAFSEGFEEGAGMALGKPVYEIKVFFEGTLLNQSTFEDLQQALKTVATHLATPGVRVEIEVGTESERATEAVAELVSANLDDEVAEAEIVG